MITGRTNVEVIVKAYRDVRYFPDFTKLNLIHNCFIIQCFEGHSEETVYHSLVSYLIVEMWYLAYL